VEIRYTTPAPSSDTSSEQSVLILELAANVGYVVRYFALTFENSGLTFSVRSASFSSPV